MFIDLFESESKRGPYFQLITSYNLFWFKEVLLFLLFPSDINYWNWLCCPLECLTFWISLFTSLFCHLTYRWKLTHGLIVWSFSYKLKLAQTFNFFSIQCSFLNSLANWRLWGLFLVSPVLLRYVFPCLHPEYVGSSSVRGGYLLANVKVLVCGVHRLSPFISHYSYHPALITFLFCCWRWLIICVHNLKFMEISFSSFV